jgi:hypothetical protein
MGGLARDVPVRSRPRNRRHRLESRCQIVSDIERIPVQKVNEAYERMLKGDVKYRFVIDMKSLKG